MAANRRVFVWMSPEQADFARATVDAAGLTPVLIGAPERARRGDADDARVVESRFPEIATTTDLRHALSTADVDVALLLTARGETDDRRRDALDDADALDVASKRGVRLFTVEPPIATIRAERRSARGGVVRFAPLMTESEGYRRAADVLEAFTGMRSLHVASRGAGRHGPLASRLWDAMTLVNALFGEPELIDASVIVRRADAGLHLTPSERLPDLTGDLNAHLRYAGARTASLSLSDDAGGWFRGATILGDAGCLRITERRFDLIDPEGQTVDASGPEDAAPDDLDQRVGAIVGGRVRAWLDAREAPTPPVASDLVLSMCEAALLSARTGQPESPATIRRMG